MHLRMLSPSGFSALRDSSEVTALKTSLAQASFKWVIKSYRESLRVIVILGNEREFDRKLMFVLRNSTANPQIGGFQNSGTAH